MPKDDKAERILRHAARLFARESYDATSIRDIARDTKISLAGLYYYFASKEEVLYTIQKNAFRFVIDAFLHKVAGVTDPRRKLAILIDNHITFFVNNMDEMKVLSHESETLTNEYHEQIALMKREYFKILVSIIEEVVGHDDHARVRAMSLFGMMNWIYNWYGPEHDPAGGKLAEQMIDIFLHGILPPGT